MDDDDAQVFAVADILEGTHLTLVDDVAGIAAVRVDAREHLHQRGFAGAVFADDRMDLAFAHGQVDVVQRLHTREAFLDAAHFQNVAHDADLSFAGLAWIT